MINDYDSVIRNDFNIKSEKFEYDFLYITNTEIETDWKVKRIKEKNCDASLINRYYKMCYFDNFDDYDYSIYLDANIRIQNNLDDLIESLDEKYGVHAHIHPHRDNQKIELAACLANRKVSFVNYLIERIAQVKDEKFQLFECGVLIKNHNEKNIKKAMHEWFLKYENSRAKRDQLYFTSSMEKKQVKIGEIKDSNLRGENTKYFKIVSGHNNKNNKINLIFKIKSLIFKIIFFIENKIN